MLVSKIKPCMSQYKLLHGETANGSLKQLSFIWWSFITWITMVILELIHASRPNFVEGLCLLGTEPTQALPGLLVIHNNRANRMASASDGSFKFLIYQLPTPLNTDWRAGLLLAAPVIPISIAYVKVKPG